MGYNISRKTVIRMKRHLDDMMKARKTISWPSHRPDGLARKIREAMKATHHHPEFQDYYALGDLYVLRVFPGYVLAQYMGEEIELPKPPPDLAPSVKEKMLVDNLNEEATEEQKANVDKWMNMDIPLVQKIDVFKSEEIIDLEGVVGAVVAFGRKYDELFFPLAVLSEESKKILFTWSSMEGWKMIDHEDGGITVTKRNVEEFLLWRPK